MQLLRVPENYVQYTKTLQDQRSPQLSLTDCDLNLGVVMYYS